MSTNDRTQKLQSVIDFVWDNKHSDFYREIWKQHGITTRPILNSLNDFNTKIPTITKDNLQIYEHPDRRLYIEKKDVTTLVSTSGTTSGKPFFRWHTHHKVSPIYKDMYEAGVRTELYTWSYHRSGPLVAASTAHTGIQTIVADPRQSEELLRHLHSRPIELISSTPSVALALADRIADKTILERVQFLMFIGEFLTPTMLGFITARYPNAGIYNLFGFSEAGCNIMVHKPACDDAHSVMHVEDENVYVNVEDTGLLSVTTLELPHPTPLIRYVSGDAGRIVVAPCGCGDDAPRIELLGREFVDFVRTGGFEIKLDYVERALTPVAEHLEPSLEVTVEEKVDEERRRPCAHLTVRVIKKVTANIEPRYLADLTKNALMDLALSPQTKLSDAIARSSFDSPEVIVDAKSTGKEKSRSIRFVS